MSLPSDPTSSGLASTRVALLTTGTLVQRFHTWMAEAESNGASDPTAMSLAAVAFRRRERRLYLPEDAGWQEQRLYP